MTKDELKQLRFELRLSQVRMAEMIGCNWRTYQGYEVGNNIPDIFAELVKYKAAEWRVNHASNN